MKFMGISLYIMYMIILLFPPWKPSLYNVFIDTIEMVVTVFFSCLLFRYHGSIPMSQKTILNYLMKVVSVGYGGIYISLWFTSALFNIFPNQGLQLLQSNPSVTCFILSADLIHLVFFINVVLIIILHAGFTAYPRLFLESDDSNMKIFIYSFNVASMVIFAYEKWTRSFCGKALIHKITNKLSLDIDEDKVMLYNEGSWLSLCLCSLAGLSVLLSKIVSFCRHSPRVIPCIVTKIVVKEDGANNGNQEGSRANSSDQDSGSYNLDAVGMYMIVTTLVFIIFVRLLMNMDMNETIKKLVTITYHWQNLALERAFGASLPLYWMFRKDHSSAYAARKIRSLLNKYLNTDIRPGSVSPA